MIKFEKVSKKLEGKAVLRDLSFEVGSGETFVILGPTGTGKSVTLKHLIRLLRPDSGTVKVDGQDISGLEKLELLQFRRKFGMVFQNGALINWMNVFDNVALPLREKRTLSREEIEKKVMSELEELDLADAAHEMPENLSGGMTKRAAIARAVAGEPEILLFDEPTAGLDPIMSRRIDKIIDSLKNRLKITSVIVTHDLITAFGIADRIGMLREGSIIESGTPSEFGKSEVDYVRKFIDCFIHKPEEMENGR